MLQSLQERDTKWIRCSCITYYTYLKHEGEGIRRQMLWVAAVFGNGTLKGCSVWAMRCHAHMQTGTYDDTSASC